MFHIRTTYNLLSIQKIFTCYIVTQDGTAVLKENYKSLLYKFDRLVLGDQIEGITRDG